MNLQAPPKYSTINSQMQFQSFKVKSFLVPEFELAQGKMIRFWVQIVPKKENDPNFQWGLKRMRELIDHCNAQTVDTRIFLCPIQHKTHWFDFIRKVKVEEYLKKAFGQRNKEIENILKEFGIQPEYTLRKMGCSHQKIFSIVYGIEKNEVIAFDFYGLGPDTEIKLMKYLHKKLEEGKSLIVFDNLGFKEENPDEQNIENLTINQI